jgi:uncharacterized repeat protein (TIGR03803 family)
MTRNQSTHSFFFSLLVIATAAVGLLAPATLLAAPRYNVLHWFVEVNGGNPSGNVIFDTAGNLYGTSYHGGMANSGTVFQLAPNANGSWTEHVLYSFCALSGCADGAAPYGTLVMDSSNNLYGTTTQGGPSGIAGAVFELVPGANDTWTQKVIYGFCKASKCTDGYDPVGGLIFDAKGNLYGTTSGGGAYGYGTVFELTPTGNDNWTETVLYSFCGKRFCPDGSQPLDSLVFDSAGNLYGTASNGANHDACPSIGCGAVFELSPGSDGNWTEKVLHVFGGGDGENPHAGLIFDGSGNLYGTTDEGGRNGNGVVFELSPTGNGAWTETVLWKFYEAGSPLGGLTFDHAGNLYGTTEYGGNLKHGTVFELSLGQNGLWTQNVLHTFNGQGGANPSGGVTFDSAGNLYGTAMNGGSGDHGSGWGVVFKIAP